MPITEFIPLLTQAGITGLLAGWLYLERSERLRLQEERDQLLERVLKGINDSATAMTSTREGVNAATSVLSSMRDLMLKGSAGEH